MVPRMHGELCPLARTQLQQILLEDGVPQSQLVLWSPWSMKMMLVIGSYLSFCLFYITQRSKAGVLPPPAATLLPL